MAAYDENGNMIQDTQSEEIIIDADNNFADYEYDDNTDIIIEQESQELNKKDEIAVETKQKFEHEFHDINETLQHMQDSNTKDNHELTQDNTANAIIQPTNTKEQEIDETKENHQNNNLDFLNKKVKKLDNLNEKDHEALTKTHRFETEFKDINEILALSNQLDNALDNNLENNNNDNGQKRDTQDLQTKPTNLEKEKENLDKALDNLVKVRSLADLIRAIYMLDEALFAIKEKRPKPEKNKTLQFLTKEAKKGFKITKEYAVMAINEIKELKGELDEYIKIRQKESEMQQKISSQTKSYKLAISPKQKESYAMKIQKNMEYVDKELPNFKKNYPTTHQRANETLKAFEKTKTKEKNADKVRTL